MNYNGDLQRMMVRYVLLTQQLGGISKCLMKLLRLQDRYCDPEVLGQQALALKLYLKCELSDAIDAIAGMCEALDLCFDEVVTLGKERRNEKKSDFEAKYPGAEYF